MDKKGNAIRPKSQSFWVYILTICLTLVLTACFHSSDDNDKTVPAPPAELKIFPQTLKITELGVDVPLTARLLDSNQEPVTVDGSDIVWQSSDESIATVDINGVVSALAAGSVSISAVYETFSQQSVVEIDESGAYVSGIARYEDSYYNTEGSDSSVANQKKFIRHAIIDLLDQDGNILDTTKTSAQGRFAFNSMLPDQYAIRILAQVDESYLSGFKVSDFGGRIYATSFTSLTGSTPQQLDVSRESIAGAFNILDVITLSAEFSQQKLGVAVSDLIAYWQRNNDKGTYYCTGSDFFLCNVGRGIYVRSQLSGSPSFDDTDEFDDDIIMHEFGHYLMENYASDDSEGGDHDLTQVDSDLRLAWSEGWGIFLPAAIKSWLQNSGNSALLSTSDITYYIDTEGSGASKKAFISYDITEPWYVTTGNNDQEVTVNFYHASSETAITKILWSIHETVDLGMEKIWDAISQQMVNLTTPTNLASFWDGLLYSDLVRDSDIDQLRTIFNERQVYYQDDASEPDDSLQTATMYTVGTSPPMTNYLYLNGLLQADEDFFVFSASAGKTYKVKTFDLQNGIDTFISIVDGSGNIVELNGVVMENDDAIDDRGIRYDPACFCDRVRHDGSAFASELNFTPNTSGDYYVKVWYSNQNLLKRPTTGHYGTYSLSITEQ